jgi:hypothetical protein
MALEDVPGLINPIIQAMIATAQLQQRGRESEIDKEKNKEDVKLRQEGLKQALKALEYQHEHNIATADTARLLAEATSKLTAAETKRKYQEYVHAGGNWLELPGAKDAVRAGQNIQAAKICFNSRRPRRKLREDFHILNQFKMFGWSASSTCSRPNSANSANSAKSAIG